MTVVSKSLILNAPLEEGLPGPEHFHIDETTVDLDLWKADLPEGSIIVQLLVLSADPYMRGRIKSFSGAVANSTISGFVAGKVLASKNSNWAVNDLFGASLPYTTYQIISSETLSKIPNWKLTEYISESEISIGVGALGMPGSTAYGGLIDVLRPNKGEIIFISAASGAVGGLVGKLAKELYGCTVIGSCGGSEKGKLAREKFGYDHTIDYKQAKTAADIVSLVKEFSPSGIDMYFENVGGIHFEAAFELLRPKGRIAICGAISEYNNAEPAPFVLPSPMRTIYNQLRVEGFVCSEWLIGKRGNFLQDMGKLYKEGKLPIQETFFEGIENWPIAFQSLFTGANVGKVVVRL